MFCSSLSCFSSRRSLLWGFSLSAALRFYLSMCLLSLSLSHFLSLSLSLSLFLSTDDVDFASLCLSVQRLSLSLCFPLSFSSRLVSASPFFNSFRADWKHSNLFLTDSVCEAASSYFGDSESSWRLRQALRGLQSCLLQESPTCPEKDISLFV